MNFISKTLIASSIALSLGLSAATSAQECELPNSPIIPDGNVASMDELLAAKEAFTAYQSNIEVYRDCLITKESEIDAESETAQAEKDAILELDGASVDKLKSVGDEFNKAVRAFKAR